eukprot:SAG22_NODE_3612_length_1616_cov_1.926170_3_plen_179_part_00
MNRRPLQPTNQPTNQPTKQTKQDCCSGYNYLQELATVYKQMKAIDPYHLTAGALECGEMHAFQEPHLSLDVPMRENYRPDLPSHAPAPLGQPLSGGGDGVLRSPPMTFEPMINMADAVRQPRQKLAVRQRSCFLKAVITAFPSVSLPFLAVPLLSQRTVAISGRRPGSRQSPRTSRCR